MLGGGPHGVFRDAVCEPASEIDLKRPLTCENLRRVLYRRELSKPASRRPRGSRQKPSGMRRQIESDPELYARGNEAPRVERDPLYSRTAPGRRGNRCPQF